MARRSFLALSALATGAGVMSGPASAADGDAGAAAGGGTRSLMEIYADQDARADGKPVFWLTRGREYLVQGGKVIPVYDRHIITAARLIPTPEGGFKRPYVESAFSTMPGETDAPPQLTSPMTGQPYPNPVIGKLRLTLWVSPAGEITQVVKLEKPKINSFYNGYVSLVHGPRGHKLLACAINARAETPSGVLDLTELGPYQVDQGQGSDGYTSTSREVIVCRDAPASLTGGAAASQIGIHPSAKYASIEQVKGAFTPMEAERYAAWLQNWESLLYAKEDVIV